MSCGTNFSDGRHGFIHEVPGLYQYQNKLMLSAFPAFHLDQIQEVNLHDEDVILVGYPRSGTVWLQEIVWLLYNNVDVAMSDRTPLLIRFPALEHYFKPGNPLGVVNSLDAVRSTEPPHLIKTRLDAHFYKKQVINGKTKAIVIIRNPKDVLVSFYHFYRMNRGYGFNEDWDTFFEMFKKRQLFWGDWSEHVVSWWVHRERSNILVLKYETLKGDLRGQIKIIAEFCGKTLSTDQLDVISSRTSFDSMKAIPSLNFSFSQYVYDFSKAPFMRSGTVGGWKEYFSPEQSGYVDEICQTLAHQYGLKFHFEL